MGGSVTISKALKDVAIELEIDNESHWITTYCMLNEWAACCRWQVWALKREFRGMYVCYWDKIANNVISSYWLTKRSACYSSCHLPLYKRSCCKFQSLDKAISRLWYDALNECPLVWLGNCKCCHVLCEYLWRSMSLNSSAPQMLRFIFMLVFAACVLLLCLYWRLGKWLRKHFLWNHFLGISIDAATTTTHFTATARAKRLLYKSMQFLPMWHNWFNISYMYLYMCFLRLWGTCRNLRPSWSKSAANYLYSTML